MAYQGQVRKDCLVAAIDFGTSYSGYAFHTYDENAKDQRKIDSPQAWNSGIKNHVSLKTPTSLLLNAKGEPDENGFGFEAEEKYKKLCKDKKHQEYYFFRDFKMQLLDEQKLTDKLMIKDWTGKEMYALDIFKLSIKCLKGHLMNLLKTQGREVAEEKVFWVLTVPAIWNDAAKQFMREAAVRAGIQPEKLEIALEPEAASFYCQYVTVGTFEGKKELIQFATAPAGTRYMVVDLGGGTADITVHERLDDGRLKELLKPSGGRWGGKVVDNAFKHLLISIVQTRVMNIFKLNYGHHYLDLFDDFEAVKRTFKQGGELHVRLPLTLNETCESELKMSFNQCLEKSDLTGEIDVDKHGSEMTIKSTLAEKLFREATDEIVAHMTSILEKGTVENITQILMVGGFSESPFVQKVISEAFDGKNGIKVIIPKDAGITIAKGAVLFGRLPQIIESRVLRFTYGLSMSPIFIEGTHPEEKKYRSDTGLRCNDVFDIIVSADSEVKNEFSVKRTYLTVEYFQRQMQLNVYYTKEKNPRFTTDPGCMLLGGLKVEIPNPSKDQRKVDITFQFGKTELKLMAQEKSSESPIATTLNMIEERFQETVTKNCSN